MQGVIVDDDEGGDDQGDGEAEDGGVVKLVDNWCAGGKEVEGHEGEFLHPDGFHHKGQDYRDDSRRQVEFEESEDGIAKTEDQKAIGPW